MNARLSCLKLRVIESIIDFLQSDYEKSDDTMKSCLRSIWCIISQLNISRDVSNRLLETLSELFDYPYLIEEILSIVHCLSTQYQREVITIIPILCKQEYESNTLRLLSLEILKNLSIELIISNEILDFIQSFFGFHSQITKCIYELLYIYAQNQIPHRIDLLNQALQDSYNENVSLSRVSSKYLTIVDCTKKLSVVLYLNRYKQKGWIYRACSALSQ